MTSVSPKAPQQSEERNTAPEGSLELTVTGLDAKSHMFRERTAVLGLEGRDCEYQSKHEVRVDSWVLLDIDYRKAGQKSCRVQGQVKSVQPLGAAHELFRIRVELEAAQSLKVVPNHKESQLTIEETSVLESPVAANEAGGRPEAGTPLRAPGTPAEAQLHTLFPPSSDGGAAAMAQSRELLASTQTQMLEMIREEVKSATISEINQHLDALRSSLSCQVEKTVQATVTSRLEKMVGDAVEKKISQTYQAALQALNSDLAHQLVSQLAENGQLGTSFENMAKKLVERLTKLSQAAAVKAEQDLNAQVTAIQRSFEETMARMQRRIKEMQAGVEALSPDHKHQRNRL